MILNLNNILKCLKYSDFLLAKECREVIINDRVLISFFNKVKCSQFYKSWKLRLGENYEKAPYYSLKITPNFLEGINCNNGLNYIDLTYIVSENCEYIILTDSLSKILGIINFYDRPNAINNAINRVTSSKYASAYIEFNKTEFVNIYKSNNG